MPNPPTDSPQPSPSDPNAASPESPSPQPVASTPTHPLTSSSMPATAVATSPTSAAEKPSVPVKPSAPPLTPEPSASTPPAPTPETPIPQTPQTPQTPAPPTPAPSTPGDPAQSKLSSRPLLIDLLSSRSNVTGVVTAWVRHLAANGPAAVASVLSLVVSAARPIQFVDADPLITVDMIVRNQPAAGIADFASILQHDHAVAVPVLSRDVQSRRACRAFSEFWRLLPPAAGDFVIFDTDCFDTLISWLESMAGANSRALRTAACIAAYRIVDGLIEVAGRLRKQLVGMNRQLTVEKRKCGFPEGTPKPRARGRQLLSKKGQELTRKVEELTANDSELTELSDKVFRAIFILKYRDIAPEIRVLSVTALGGWISACPEHFLDDVHNKYIGWLLSDKEAIVRRTSLNVLIKMLRRSDFFPILELFLQRFCGRIVEMSHDKDDSVAVAAIQLLTLLVSFGMVDNDSRVSICDMAAEESHVDIRRAAGEFLGHIITSDNSNVGGPTKRRLRAADGSINSSLKEIPDLQESITQIKELLFALTHKGEEDLSPELAVDAVWDHIPALRNWKAFGDLLLERTEGKRRGRKSNPNPNDDLNALDKAILCEMLLKSATEASGQGDTRRARVVEQGEFNNIDTPGIMFTLHFLSLLPQLLIQFQGDAKAMKALVKLPTVFSSMALERDGQEQHFSELLNRLVDALTRHTAYADVTTACGETFRALLADRNPLKQVTIAALQLASRTAANDLCVETRSKLDSMDPDRASAAVLRVRILSELIEPSRTIHDPLMKLLQYQLEEKASDLSDITTIDAIRIAYTTVVWSLLRIRSRLESLPGSGVSLFKFLKHEEITEVCQHGLSVVDQLTAMCPAPSLPLKVRSVALHGLLTTLTVCRGIEKFAMSKVLPALTPTEEDQIERDHIEDLDFLRVQSKCVAVVEAIKSCIFAITNHQRDVIHKNKRTVRAGRRPINQNSTEITDSDVSDSFAVLVQASSLSIISSEVAHLPLLGLMLKQSKSHDSDGPPDLSTYNMCRLYYGRRQIRNGNSVNDELLLLKELAGLDSSTHCMSSAAQELAEALVASMRVKDDKAQLSKRLITGLIDYVSENFSDEEKILDGVGLLSVAGLGVVSTLDTESAMGALEQLKNMSFSFEDERLAEQSDAVLSAFNRLVESVEGVVSGQHVAVKEAVKASRLGSRGGRQARGARKKDEVEKKWVGGSKIEVNGGSRRHSGRSKKVVNYARLGGMDSGDEESESNMNGNEEEMEQEEEEVIAKDSGKNAKETAAELARNMMQFSNSPRMGGPSAGRTVSKVALDEQYNLGDRGSGAEDDEDIPGSTSKQSRRGSGRTSNKTRLGRRKAQTGTESGTPRKKRARTGMHTWGNGEVRASGEGLRAENEEATGEKVVVEGEQRVVDSGSTRETSKSSSEDEEDRNGNNVREESSGDGVEGAGLEVGARKERKGDTGSVGGGGIGVRRTRRTVAKGGDGDGKENGAGSRTGRESAATVIRRRKHKRW